jgi:hypothetical protein
MGESFLIQKLIQAGGDIDYSAYVVKDVSGVKYTIYNGYDALTNPTPDLTNLSFNQWIRNDGATGTEVLNNVSMINYTFNGSGSVLDPTVLTFINTNQNTQNINTYGGSRLQINNGFIYLSGSAAGVIKKFELDTLKYVGQTPYAGGDVGSFGILNNSIFVAGTFQSPQNIDVSPFLNSFVSRYNETTLAFVNRYNPPGSANSIRSQLLINSPYVYFIEDSGDLGDRVVRVWANNLVFQAATLALTTTLTAFGVSNNIITSQNNTLRRYSSSLALQLTGATGTGGSRIAINNSFVYVLGGTNGIRKYNQGALTLVGSSHVGGKTFTDLTINNGFIYAIANNTIEKYNETTLSLVGNTIPSTVNFSNLISDNEFIYTTTRAVNVQLLRNDVIRKFKEIGTSGNLINYHVINTVK